MYQEWPRRHVNCAWYLQAIGNAFTCNNYPCFVRLTLFCRWGTCATTSTWCPLETLRSLAIAKAKCCTCLKPNPTQPTPSHPNPSHPIPSRFNQNKPHATHPDPNQHRQTTTPTQPNPPQPNPAQPNPTPLTPTQPNPTHPNPTQTNATQPTPPHPNPAQPTSTKPNPTLCERGWVGVGSVGVRGWGWVRLGWYG